MEYLPITTFKDGSSVVELKHKQGLINRQGIEIIPVKYDSLDVADTSSAYGPYFIAKQRGKQGLFNKYGKLIVPIKYDFVMLIVERFTVIVVVNDKQGLLDFNGKVLIPIKYRSIGYDYGCEEYTLKLNESNYDDEDYYDYGDGNPEPFVSNSECPF